MFAVGTLAAVSALISSYPVYGGQAMRYAVAAALLFAVAAFRGQGLLRLTPREWAYLITLAALGLVAFNTFIIEATHDASPALIGTIIGTVPIVLAVIGPLAQRRAPAPRVLIGASIVVIGATLATGLGGGGLRGILFSLGALACEAAFSLLALPLLPKLGAIRVSAYASAAAVPMLLVFGFATAGTAMFRVPNGREAFGLAYLTVVVSAGAFLLWYSALPKLGADRAGLFAGVLPIGAVVTTAVLGLGNPSPAEMAGAALVVLGVLAGMSRPRPRPVPALAADCSVETTTALATK